MTTDLIDMVSTEVDRVWMWRMRGGDMAHPSSMGTLHLLNTLVMIWNHSMPADAKTHTYIPYKFGPFYTEAYMKKAIRELAVELAKRNDLGNAGTRKLEKMLAYLHRNQISGIAQVFIR